MRYSLRTFLIVATVLGVGVGGFIRLKDKNPEALVFLMQIFGTIVPFLAAVVTVIVLGIRGSERRNARLLIWGMALLLAPAMLLLFTYQYPNAYSLLSNARLTSADFAGQVDNPQVWIELQRRFGLGELSRAEVDSAVTSLVAAMKQVQASGGRTSRQPLPWAGQFVAAAQGANMISTPALVELFDAYNGRPALRTPSVTSWNDGWRCDMNVEYGNPFARSLGPTWTVAKILVDNREATSVPNGENSTAPESATKFHGGGSIAMGHCLLTTPGEHDIEIHLEVAFPAGGATGTGFTNSDPATWGPVIKRQTLKVKAKVTTAE